MVSFYNTHRRGQSLGDILRWEDLGKSRLQKPVIAERKKSIGWEYSQHIKKALHLTFLMAKGADFGEKKINLGEAIGNCLQGQLHLSSMLREGRLVINKNSVLIMHILTCASRRLKQGE